MLVREGEGRLPATIYTTWPSGCSPGYSWRVYKTADYPDHVMVIVALSRFAASDIFHVTAIPSLRQNATTASRST